MSLPNRNRNWLKEIQASYAKAQRDLQREASEPAKIYIFAVKYVAKNRGIKDKDVIRRMISAAIDSVKLEHKMDPATEAHHLFHFVSTYIYSHHQADLMDEIACDRVMEYLNAQWDLFPESPLADNPPGL